MLTHHLACYKPILKPANLIDNSGHARKYLVQEYHSIDSFSHEMIIENISITGKIVRLNLRPYKSNNGDIEKLFQALLHSSEEISASKHIFIDLWNEFKQAVFKDKLPFDKEKFKTFDEKICATNYPVMHHSPEYRESNQPSYRVLKLNLAEKLLAVQDIKYCTSLMI